MKILLVDDEEDIRKVARLSLVGVGKFDVMMCSGAADALTAAGESQFDLILMDMMMPGMDGLEGLRRMREADITTPVVFMTAKVQKKEVEGYLAAGALGVIEKPFNPMTLPDEIRGILKR